MKHPGTGYSVSVMNNNPVDASRRMRLVHADVAADPHGVRFLRTAVDAWLQHNFSLEHSLLSDMTLATNEALANAAEHAYPDPATAGTMALHAVYDETQDQVSVIVTDQGRWQTAAADPLSLRGHGIPLIKALTHRCRIDTSSTGTQVTLQWTNFRTHLLLQ